MSISHLFSHCLPLDHSYDFLLVHTVPYQCKKLINGPSSLVTIKIKNALTVIDDHGLILFGIEIFTYLTVDSLIHRHFFVNKVDTTGLATLPVKVADIVAIYITYLCNINPNSQLHKVKLTPEIPPKPPHCGENDTLNALVTIIDKLRRSPDYYNSIPYYNKGSANAAHHRFSDLAPTELPYSTSFSLFTRPANDYLFPLSHKNPGKHLIDGNKLLIWWLKLIDSLPLLWDLRKVTVPGAESSSIAKYLLHVSDSWEVGNIFNNANSGNLAIYNIPVFPDDPKGRFLEHLVVENRYKTVDLDQFWEELGYRQEFRLGDVVGIIGCQLQVTPPTSSKLQDHIELTPKSYKNLMNLIKGVDFSVKSDIVALTKVAIPQFFQKLEIRDFYATVKGTKVVSTEKKSRSNRVVNHLPVRKKTEPAINNLSGIVKKKKPKLNLTDKRLDLTSQIDEPPVNNSTIKLEQPSFNDTAIQLEQPPVNDLTAQIKRKQPTVNDLTAQIKRRPKKETS